MIAFSLSVLAAETATNQTTTAAPVTDPFEADFDLRYAADTFCREITIANPQGKIVLPYKPDCHFWWQCTAYELKKHECQGANHRIVLHYDLYLDRCEMPSSVKCNYVFDEEEIIMEHIMEFYQKTPDRE